MPQAATITPTRLHIALNGTPEFHSKAASATKEILPDQVSEAHRELALNLQGAGVLLAKTAAFVSRGYPAKTALNHVGREAGMNDYDITKFASFLDTLAGIVLSDSVMDTIERKVEQKTAQSRTPSAAPPSNPTNGSNKNRVDAAIKRFQQLGK